MRILFFLFILAALFPSVHAQIECSKTIHQDYCTEIQNSPISDEEKEYLLADIFSDTKQYPDHNLVKTWNRQIPTNQKPTGIPTQTKGVIKNAWMTMLAITSSVEFDNKLYIDTAGEVLTAQDYDIELSRDTDSGDCRTEHSLQQHQAALTFYVNNQAQNNNHFIAQYNHNTPVILKAEYTIIAQTKVDHYRWKWVRFGDGSQRVCRYASTEYLTDQLTVRQQRDVMVHNPELIASFTVKDQYRDTIIGNFNFSEDIVNTELLFDNSYYKHHNYVFSEKYDGVLAEYAQRQPNTEEWNLAVTDGHLVVSSISGCKIKLSSFFKEVELPCNPNLEHSDFTVTLLKSVYSDGEIVQLHLEPAGEYHIEYAGEEQQNGFPAKYGNSEIIIRHGNRELRQYIHVKNDKPLNAAFFLGVFGTLNYTIAGLIKKYWGVAL